MSFRLAPVVDVSGVLEARRCNAGPPGVAGAGILAVAPHRSAIRRVPSDAEIVSPAAAAVRRLAGDHQGTALQLTSGIRHTATCLPELSVFVGARSAKS